MHQGIDFAKHMRETLWIREVWDYPKYTSCAAHTTAASRLALCIKWYSTCVANLAHMTRTVDAFGMEWAHLQEVEGGRQRVGACQSGQADGENVHEAPTPTIFVYLLLVCSPP